jgi:HEAT repeat protein
MNRGHLSRISLWVLVFLCPLLARAGDRTEEARLIAILQSGSSPREKDAACAQLKRIGTEKSVPALAALLTDDQLSHSARYALESMQAPEAGVALLDALSKATGSNEIGIINSLAARKEMASIPPLSALLSDANGDVAVAAFEGLGRIGGTAALAALEAAPPNPSAAIEASRIDALLTIANELLTQDDKDAARKIFQQIYDGERKGGVRLAAFRGLILSSGERGIELMSNAITGADASSQGAALQVASTLEGAAVTQTLADLLPKTQPPVQIALLQCLAQRRDAAAMPAVEGQVDSPDPDVRLAAISALGDLGDGSVALLLAQKAAASTGAEKSAARQSLLDLRRGAVTGALIEAVGAAKPEVRLELLRALGGRGDKSALPQLIELARSDDDSTRAASFQALELLAGPPQISDLIRLVVDAKNGDARSESAEALGVVYQRVQSQGLHAEVSPLADAVRSAPLEARLSLLPVCAGLNDATAREALRAAVKDPDAQVREAAIGAVCDTHDPEMLPDLIQLASGSGEKKFQLMAIGGCVRLSKAEEGASIPMTTKLRAFKTILDTPLDAAERRLLLSGLGAIADEQALAMALPMLDDDAVRPEAARAVIQIAGAISGAQSEPAGAALKKVLGLSVDAAAQKAAEAALQQIQEMAAYITTWQVAGPYEQAGKNFSALFDIPFAPEGAESDSAKWQTLPGGTDPAQPCNMDLLRALGGEQRVAYARTWIYSPDERAARLEIGSDDGVKVWLNGQLIHSNNASRALQPGSDKVDATLHQGWNRMLLKVTQNTAGWGFCVRLAGPDGVPITGVRASAVPPG